jgi:hypothetical protein
MTEAVSHEQSEQECVICTVSSTEFIAFNCKHSCCKECFNKIDKCHMCRAPIIINNPMKVILVFPGNIITAFYFDPCEYYNNERLTSMSNKFLRLVPNVWKYEFESITIRGSAEYDDELMEFLIDNDNVLDDYLNVVLDRYGYDAAQIVYNLDFDKIVSIINLMNYIRYKLIRHDNDRVRDIWLERRYRWRRTMFGSGKADKFLGEYGHRGQVLD